MIYNSFFLTVTSNNPDDYPIFLSVSGEIFKPTREDLEEEAEDDLEVKAFVKVEREKITGQIISISPDKESVSLAIMDSNNPKYDVDLEKNVEFNYSDCKLILSAAKAVELKNQLAPVWLKGNNPKSIFKDDLYKKLEKKKKPELVKALGPLLGKKTSTCHWMIVALKIVLENNEFKNIFLETNKILSNCPNLKRERQEEDVLVQASKKRRIESVNPMPQPPGVSSSNQNLEIETKKIEKSPTNHQEQNENGIHNFLPGQTVISFETKRNKLHITLEQWYGLKSPNWLNNAILNTFLFSYFKDKDVCVLDSLVFTQIFTALYPNGDENQKLTYEEKKNRMQTEDIKAALNNFDLKKPVVFAVNYPNNTHWTLVIVSKAKIFLFDSFMRGNYGDRIVKILQEGLTLHFGINFSFPPQTYIKNIENFQQEGTFDCGAFVCYFAKLFHASDLKIFPEMLSKLQKPIQICLRNEIATHLLSLCSDKSTAQELKSIILPDTQQKQLCEKHLKACDCPWYPNANAKIPHQREKNGRFKKQSETQTSQLPSPLQHLQQTFEKLNVSPNVPLPAPPKVQLSNQTVFENQLVKSVQPTLVALNTPSVIMSLKTQIWTG